MTRVDDEFGLALGAISTPDRIAVSDDYGVSYTYGDLNDLVNRVINALYQAGMAEDEVFAVLADNRADVVALHQAAFRGGFLFTPMNPRLRPGEIEYLIRDSGARYLFVDVDYLSLVETLEPSTGPLVVTLGGSAPGRTNLAELIAGSHANPIDYKFGGPLSYTSGTTGLPKAVTRERRKPPIAVMKQMARFGERLGFDPHHDRHLATAPLYHGGPMVSAMHAINLGGSVHLMRHFEPEHVLHLMERMNITSSYMVPTMYHRMMQLPPEVRRSYDVSSLRSVMHTGAPCPVDLKYRMMEWLGPVVYECYAATEALGTYTVCTPQQWLAHPGTVGKPENDVITIRDETGQALPAGSVGLIYAQTLPGVAPFEYKGDPDKTADAYGPDGDYTIGDMGYLDEDGFLYITGRASDMVITGGINVYPAEVEQAILGHPAVRDVAVFGVPDEEWGERVVAAVQLADVEVTEEELITFAREHVATYKSPRQIFFVDDLGRDPSGKLRKQPLRERVLQGEP